MPFIDSIFTQLISEAKHHVNNERKESAIMRSYGYTRIRQLPESKVLSPTDYMVMENDNDTWKVLVSTFNQYISESIYIFEGDI